MTTRGSDAGRARIFRLVRRTAAVYVRDMAQEREPPDQSQRQPPRTLELTPNGPVRSTPVVDSDASSAARPAAAGAGATNSLTARRKALAFAIAAISDAISFGSSFAPPVQLAVDAVTAALLFWVLGFRWQLMPALVAEALPVVAAFPTWTLAVGVLIGVTPTAPRAP